MLAERLRDPITTWKCYHNDQGFLPRPRQRPILSAALANGAATVCPFVLPTESALRRRRKQCKHCLPARRTAKELGLCHFAYF